MESKVDSFLDSVSKQRMVSQSKIIKHGTIHRQESGGMESMGEGKLRILHHVDRGKMANYCQEAIKNSLANIQDERIRGNNSN